MTTNMLFHDYCEPYMPVEIPKRLYPAGMLETISRLFRIKPYNATPNTRAPTHGTTMEHVDVNTHNSNK